MKEAGLILEARFCFTYRILEHLLRMRFLLISVFVIGIMNSVSAQFPKTWIGKFAGTMTISTLDAPNDSVSVTLEISELKQDSVWTYQMHYFSEKYGKIEKNYQIVRTDNKWQRFIMDELNGIELQMSYLNDSFYEFFEVEGTLYATTTRMIGNTLLFEIFGTPRNSAKEMVSHPNGNDEVYTVTTMPATFVQSVILLRIR